MNEIINALLSLIKRARFIQNKKSKRQRKKEEKNNALENLKNWNHYWYEMMTYLFFNKKKSTHQKHERRIWETPLPLFHKPMLVKKVKKETHIFYSMLNNTNKKKSNVVYVCIERLTAMLLFGHLFPIQLFFILCLSFK